MAALLLAGCGSGAMRSFFGPPDEEDVEVASAPPAEEAAPSLAARLALPPAARAPLPAERAALPVERAARASAKPPAVRETRPAPVPVVPAPMISVAGLSEAEVLSVMGEPQQRSERTGRKVWIYTGAGCRVEVSFFRDVTRGVYAALAQKVVSADGASGETCARSLRSASR